MDKIIKCWKCRKEFVPDKVYEFPACFVYWHNCMMGNVTQITVDKERQFWFNKPEMTEQQNINRTLDEFYRYRTDPLLWYKEFHADIKRGW